MNLVTSHGGPLIVVPHSVLAQWEGAFPPADGRVISVPRQFDRSSPATDYDRACCASPGVGILSVGDAEALVLSREAQNAIWLPRDKSGRGNVFLSQIWLDDAEQFQASLVKIADRKFPPGDTLWNVKQPQMRLFEASMPGADIATPWEDIELVPALYEVQTMFVELPGVAGVFMHKLVPRN